MHGLGFLILNELVMYTNYAFEALRAWLRDGHLVPYKCTSPVIFKY